MDALKFFDELFSAAIGDGTKMTVWTHKNGEAGPVMYFESTESAAEYADSVKDANVYFGLGLTKAILSEKKRPSSALVCGIPGFWIDIDIACHGAHKAGNLPASQQDAEELILATLPRHMPPTILAHSGHGLHAYWLFKEPWMFETDDERSLAAHMLQRFVLSFKFHAAMRGWKLDSVFDLARVLRVPGSINHKVPGMPMTCRVISIKPDLRYNAEDFEQYFVSDASAINDDGISQLLSKDKNPLGLVLSAYAAAPFAKFDTLFTMEERFRRSWNMQRTDLKDQSFSSYDMSIATFCATYRWSDQEIADTLIAFRMKHAKSDSEKKKALRVDYLCRTIMRAKKQKKDDDRDESLSAVLAQSEQAKEGSIAPPSNKQIAETLKPVLCVDIDRVVRYVGDEPTFEMFFTDGTSIMLGDVDGLISHRNLKKVLAAQKKVVIGQIKSTIWADYAKLLMAMVEDVLPSSDDSTKKGSLSAMISAYLERNGAINNPDGAVASSRPFRKDGRTYMFSTAFRMWAKMNDDGITKKELAVVASSLGIKSVSMKFNVGSDDAPKRTTRTVYDVTAFASGGDKCEQELPGLQEVDLEESIGAIQ